MEESKVTTGSQCYFKDNNSDMSELGPQSERLPEGK